MDTRREHDSQGLSAEVHEQGASGMLIVFRVDELCLGIDVRQVREVARAIPLSAPPSNAGGVAGMITLRGESSARGRCRCGHPMVRLHHTVRGRRTDRGGQCGPRTVASLSRGGGGRNGQCLSA